MGNENLTKKDLRETLGEFTEQVLLPAVESIVDDKIGQAVVTMRGEMGKLKSDMIDYIDRRITSSTGEVVATIRGDRERDRVFKTKLVDLLKRRQLVDEHELLIFQELIP